MADGDAVVFCWMDETSFGRVDATGSHGGAGNFRINAAIDVFVAGVIFVAWQFPARLTAATAVFRGAFENLY